MTRVFRALGITAAGFFVCLYLALISTNRGNPSDRLNHLAAVFVATPIVCLILFFVSFFLFGVSTTEIHSDQALQHSGRTKPAIKSESTSTGFDLIRLLTSIVLSLLAGCGSFVLVKSFIQKNYDSGGWFDSLVAQLMAWIVAPVFAIAGFLLVFYVMGLFRPKAETIEIDS